MKLIRATTHIRLDSANVSKLGQLDMLADAYMQLCQAYIKAFSTEVEPNKYADAWLTSPLSARWQRVVIQHAAWVALSWRTNQERAYQAYLDDLADYQAQADPQRLAPSWRDWQKPTLKQTVIYANANVVALEPSEDSTFDYWLRISTLEKGMPIRLPIKLAAYHRRRLNGMCINTSMMLTRKESGWWLTLTVDEHIAATTTNESPVVEVDVGIANFLTTSAGKHYGSFHGKLARKHKLDREKRRRKAKLRACLRKKGITCLPSLTNQRLGRHVRQEINRAVNQFYADHPDYQIAYENLDVRAMRFRARRMNAYLYASNLAHLPKQILWNAKKRGQTARTGWAAYSSQECSLCHFVSRTNRPDQQTFCCQACGFQLNADENAAINHQHRFHDREMQACRTKEDVKALLDVRHIAYLQSSDASSASARREPPSGAKA